MSVRSSARLELVAFALLAALSGCREKKQAKLPEADPGKLEKIGKAMIRHVPVPGGARTCRFDELMGGATLTKKTMWQMAKETPEKRPDVADYVNPTELDSPAVRQLVDSTDETLRRQAAAELLRAPFFLVYHVDLVDTPLAFGVKDFKRPTVGARALRYDKAGTLQCLYVYFWASDPTIQAWAVAQTTRPLVDPTVVKKLQDDLRAQTLIRVAALAAPPPKIEGPADDRSERH